MALPLGTAGAGVALGGSSLSRVRQGAYTGPESGTRITFAFKSLPRTTTKRGTVFEFAGVNDAYLQQRGFGPRNYAIRAVFNGDTHDLEATAFEAALLEAGIGLLEHPIHGSIKVVPWGDIRRDNDTVDSVNESTVDVTFSTSIEDLYPAGLSNPQSEIQAALDGFDVASAQEFEEGTSLFTAASRANFKSSVLSALSYVSESMSTVSDATASARREFADKQALINRGIDVLVGQPLLLARQINDLIRAPAKALAGIERRFEGYARLFESVQDSKAGKILPAYSQIGLALAQQNELQVGGLVAYNAVAGTVASVLASIPSGVTTTATNTTNIFRTRPQALAAIEDLLSQFDEVVAWREEAFLNLGILDYGAAYQQLHQAVVSAAGYLLQLSFGLVSERRITVSSPTTAINLCSKLYGSIDDKLELLITSNDLTGDEILEVPRGRTIVYYPAQ